MAPLHTNQAPSTTPAPLQDGVLSRAESPLKVEVGSTLAQEKKAGGPAPSSPPHAGQHKRQPRNGTPAAAADLLGGWGGPPGGSRSIHGRMLESCDSLRSSTPSPALCLLLCILRSCITCGWHQAKSSSALYHRLLQLYPAHHLPRTHGHHLRPASAPPRPASDSKHQAPHGPQHSDSSAAGTPGGRELFGVAKPS